MDSFFILVNDAAMVQNGVKNMGQAIKTVYKTIAVVTPCRNSEKYLSETIDSVINQRGDFYIDYIVVDCCSTDKTIDILERYKRLLEENGEINCRGITFRYISEKDNGMYDGLVKGFMVVRGDISCYINSDDFYLPNAFQTIVNLFEAENVKWVTGLPCLYNEYGAIMPSMTPCIYKSELIQKGVYGRTLPHIQQESTFWSSELFGEIEFSLLAKFNLAGDFYLWHRFSKTHKLFTVNTLLSGFRWHAGNMSKNSDEYQREFDGITEGYINAIDSLYILFLKVVFKYFGNTIVGKFPSVIDIHQ